MHLHHMQEKTPGLFLGETDKAHARRTKEGWFDKYAPSFLCGIDIGCGSDPLNATFRRYDQLIPGCDDAHFLRDVPNNTFYTVYASHILQFLEEPLTAVENWFRILAPSGHLIIVVPHRDLFEQQKDLDRSIWNPLHKTLWMPLEAEKPFTWSLTGTIKQSAGNDAQIVSLRTLDEGYKSYGHEKPPEGEYSIEAIITKTMPTE